MPKECAPEGRRGRRVQLCVTKPGKLGPVLSTPGAVCSYLRGMENNDREVLNIVHLDSQNRAIGLEEAARGTINSLETTPREVFKGAVLSNAVSIIVAHNHPSGMLQPSDADVLMTKRLVETGKILGIGVRDHVIVGDEGNCLSMRMEGIAQGFSGPGDRAAVQKKMHEPEPRPRPRVDAPLGLRGPAATRTIWIVGGAALVGGVALWWWLGRRRPWSGWVAPVGIPYYRGGWGDPRQYRDGVHEGLDFFVEEGTPVRAVDAGVASYVGDGSNAGKMVVVDHGNGFKTRYMHLSEQLAEQGKRVARGEVIALSGKTGISSSAAHLHLDVRVNADGLAAYRSAFGDPASGFPQHGEEWAVPPEPLGPWWPEEVTA